MLSPHPQKRHDQSQETLFRVKRAQPAAIRVTQGIRLPGSYERNQQPLQNRMTLLLPRGAIRGLVTPFNALAPLNALLIGGYPGIRGETDIGIVVAFATGLKRLSNPLRELISSYRVAAQANV